VKELTESVNSMVESGRRSAKTRRGDDRVANGDLSKKITVDVRAEILQLKKPNQYDGDQLRSVRRRK